MTSLRRRLFVPCVLIWTALAWLSVIGVRPPIDPSTTSWAHGAGQLVLVLTAGVALVWPASVLLGQQRRFVCFGESLLLSLLLGGAVMGLRTTIDDTIAGAASTAALLALWTLCMGGLTALAGTHGRWIGWLSCAAVLVLLPLSTLVEPSIRVSAGPLAAAWMMSEHTHLPLAELLPGFLTAGVLTGGCWWACCSAADKAGECPV